MILLILFLNLVVTVLIEGVVIWLLFRSRNILYCSLLGNLLTNPALNLLLFICAGLWGAPYYATVIPLELAAFFIEFCLYRTMGRLTAGRALLASLLANAISFGAGLALSLL